MKDPTLVTLICAWAAIAFPSEGEYRLDRDWPKLPEGVRFGEVSGLDVDSHGHLFVFHRAGRGWEPEAAEPIAEPTIFQIDGDTGVLLQSWGAGMFLLPHGLTVDHEDNIWLTDVALHQVFRFSHDGELLLELGTAREPGWDAAHFDRPTDVAVSADGSFYVSDGYGNSRVARFTSDGRFLYEWGKKGSGSGELHVPHGIALLPDGNIIVADRENARVQVFDPRGRFVDLWSNRLGRVFSVSVGRDGAVYTGIRREDREPDSNGVIKLERSADWTEIDRVGFSGEGEAVFHAVHDVAVGPKGTIYVGETRTRTVRKLAPRSETSFVDLLARTNAKVEQFQFSPDGERIAYLSAANGDHHIWVMNADGTNAHPINPHNPVRQVSDGPSVQPRWSPDGRWISYRSRGLPFMVRSDASAPPVNLPYGRRASAPVWTPDGKTLVFVTGSASGHSQIASIPSRIPNGPIEVTYLTDAPFNNTDPRISPDGKWLAFSSDRRGKDDIKGNDIWMKPITGGAERLLTPNMDASFEYSPRWSPDSRKIAFVSNRSGWRNIGVIDVVSGEIRMLTSSEWDEHNPQWSPDGRFIAYVANKDWNFHLMKVAAEGGAPIQLTTRDGVNGGIEAGQTRGTFRWSPDGETIAFTHMSPTTSSDIWIMPADGGTPKRLTNHMPDGLSDDDFVTPELISYPSLDGLTIPAFIYKPRPRPADREPPLLLYARANTHGNHVNGFYPFIQYFVSKGYVVLAPQVRGSQGNGREYEWLNFGDWGGRDVDDLIAGIDYLVSEGLVDPDRVVMQGGSTGGFFVMSLIQRYPDRLRAAVNFYGPTNLVHMYNMWAPAERPILGDVVGGDHGNPDEAPEHWRGRSAYFHIDEIETPLLILWGDRDYSVRISMADEYFELAKQKGKPTEYFLYDDEPHGWYHWRPEDLKDAILRVAAHYDKHF